MSALMAGFHRSPADAVNRFVQGATLGVTVHTLDLGAVIEFDAGLLGEEVGAVLEGACHVRAAGESYTLSAGQVIVIPAREPRRYEAMTAQLVVYRVVVNTPLESGA
jgi:quercetin dioxygenase-like cupin family protein